MSTAQRPAQFDFNQVMARFTPGQLVIAGASILLLIDSILSGWLKVSFDCGPTLPNCGGSDSGATLYHGWGWLTFLALLAVIAFFVIRNFLAATVQLPALPVADPIVYIGLGAVEVLGILLFWLEYRADSSSASFSAGVGPGWAWFVGLILAVATIVGGVLTQQDPVVPVAAGTPGGPGGYAAANYGATPAQPQYGAPQYGTPPSQQTTPMQSPGMQPGYGGQSPAPPGYGAPPAPPQGPYGQPPQG